MINNPEQPSFQSENFQASLDSILSRQLTPETINTYAANALDELVELAERATSTYDRQPTLAAANKTETEDYSFKYFKLGQLEKSLDHVVNLAESINSIDDVIENAFVTDGVIVPPDHVERTIQPGDGSFIEKTVHERLKTTILVLQQNFDVNIRDPEQFVLTTGRTNDIMRNASYSLIEASKLNRSILVCDEEGNATYIFDKQKLDSLGMSQDLLMATTKEQLRALLSENQDIGRRVVYSKDMFVEQLTSLLDNIPLRQIDTLKTDTTDAEMLTPTTQPPEGWLTVPQIAQLGEVSNGTVRKSMSRLGLQGEIFRQRTKGKPSPHYSPDDINVFLNDIEENPVVPQRVSGRMTANEMARELGLVSSSPYIYSLLSMQPSRVEQVNYKPSKTYSEDIFTWLKQQDEILELVSHPIATENIEAGSTFAKKWNLSPMTIEKTARKYHMPVGNFRFGTRRAEGYTESDRNFLHNILTKDNYFVEEAVEGADFSLHQIAKQIESNTVTVEKVVGILKENDPEFGDYVIKKVGNNRTKVLSWAQVDKIENYISVHNMRRQRK